jgi:hypothetical protein
MLGGWIECLTDDVHGISSFLFGTVQYTSLTTVMVSAHVHFLYVLFSGRRSHDPIWKPAGKPAYPS